MGRHGRRKAFGPIEPSENKSGDPIKEEDAENLKRRGGDLFVGGRQVAQTEGNGYDAIGKPQKGEAVFCLKTKIFLKTK